MPTFAGGKIECLAGPPDLGAPDDLESAIVSFIEGATESVDVAVQELDNEPIAEALIKARLAKKSVRVVLNHSYLQDEAAPTGSTGKVADLATAESPQRANRDIFSALCRCGVEVRIDFNHDYIFHQKFVVRDLRLRKDGGMQSGGAPGLLTGSANFTDTDCHTNLNHVVVFHHAGVTGEYAVEFAEIYAGQFGRGLVGAIPKTHDVEGVPVKVLFAPDHGPEAEIIKQLLKCPPGGRVDFAIFTFAGSSGIDDAMTVLAGAERQVGGVIDPSQSQASWAASQWLIDGGVELRVPNRQEGFRKLHHKLMVVDNATTLAGSFNYTQPANLFNDENLFVMGSPYSESEGVEVNQAASAEIASYFGAEIERIMGNSSPWAG